MGICVDQSAPVPTMIGPDEALRLVLRETRQLPPRSVPLAAACGLSLAEPIAADRDSPPFDRAMMDGFAVRASDAGKTVRLAGEIPAGCSPAIPLAEGTCLAILTGAPCPRGTEAVVQQEHARVEGGSVLLPREIRHGQHIAPQGSECPAGRIVLHPGATITPLAIAVIASFGRDSVRVIPRPRVGIVTTGGELVAPGLLLQASQIRDSNGPMLVGMCCDLGVAEPRHLHAEDEPEAILIALARAEECEIVLLTGGVSVGRYDLVPQALKTYGAELVFHKVRQKPGKPLLFARKGPQLFFGLPGNPLAAHLCFHRYAGAAIRQMSGKAAVVSPLLGRLTAGVEPKGGRTYFVTARAEQAASNTGHQWLVTPLPGLSSADIFGSCRANCYAEVPPGNESLEAGDGVRFTWVGNAPWSN